MKSSIVVSDSLSQNALTLRMGLAAGTFKRVLALGLPSLAQRAFETFARHRRGQLCGMAYAPRPAVAPAAAVSSPPAE